MPGVSIHAVDVASGKVAAGMRIEQIGVDIVDKCFDGRAAGRIGDAKFRADGGQQFFHRELGIEDISDVAIWRDLFEQAAANRRFSRADFAREQHESAVAADAIEQMGKRLLVALAHVEVAGVGRDGEWRFAEAEVFTVHDRAGGGPLSPDAGGGAKPHRAFCTGA